VPDKLDDRQRALFTALAELESGGAGSTQGVTRDKDGGRVATDDVGGLLDRVRAALSTPAPSATDPKTPSAEHEAPSTTEKKAPSPDRETPSASAQEAPSSTTVDEEASTDGAESEDERERRKKTV